MRIQDNLSTAPLRPRNRAVLGQERPIPATLLIVPDMRLDRERQPPEVPDHGSKSLDPPTSEPVKDLEQQVLTSAALPEKQPIGQVADMAVAGPVEAPEESLLSMVASQVEELPVESHLPAASAMDLYETAVFYPAGMVLQDIGVLDVQFADMHGSDWQASVGSVAAQSFVDSNEPDEITLPTPISATRRELPVPPPAGKLGVEISEGVVVRPVEAADVAMAEACYADLAESRAAMVSKSPVVAAIADANDEDDLDGEFPGDVDSRNLGDADGSPSSKLWVAVADYLGDIGVSPAWQNRIGMISTFAAAIMACALVARFVRQDRLMPTDFPTSQVPTLASADLLSATGELAEPMNVSAVEAGFEPKVVFGQTDRANGFQQVGRPHATDLSDHPATRLPADVDVDVYAPDESGQTQEGPILNRPQVGVAQPLPPDAAEQFPTVRAEPARDRSGMTTAPVLEIDFTKSPASQLTATRPYGQGEPMPSSEAESSFAVESSSRVQQPAFGQAVESYSVLNRAGQLELGTRPMSQPPQQPLQQQLASETFAPGYPATDATRYPALPTVREGLQARRDQDVAMRRQEPMRARQALRAGDPVSNRSISGGGYR